MINILKYNDIKKTLAITRNKIVENANKDLKIEFPTLKGMSARNLRYMQKFATEFDNDEFLQHHVAKLSLLSFKFTG